MATPAFASGSNLLGTTYSKFIASTGAATDPRNPSALTTQFFPRGLAAPEHLRVLRPTFTALNDFVFEQGCAGNSVPSYLALEQVVNGLQGLGYEVEHQATTVTGHEKKQKVSVPVLFGMNGVAMRHHESDAVHWDKRTVIEVEAGTAVSSNAYLKDLFEASLAINIDYLALAVRKLYVTDKVRGNTDFATVHDKLETLFLSEKLSLPLKGVLLIGY